MDTAALQSIADVASKGGNLSMFVILYFAWMSYRSLTRMEVMLELALKDRGLTVPKVERVPFTARRRKVT